MSIVVSPHARQRFRERFPANCSDDGCAYRTIRGEVEDALNENRWSPKKPAWAIPRRNISTGTNRFVWDEDKLRCYPLLRRNLNGVKTWIVATVLEAPDEETLQAHRNFQSISHGKPKSKLSKGEARGSRSRKA